jgi:hypothetical protein
MLRPTILSDGAAVDTDSLVLVEIIELKWLLAGEGFRLHVERLQTDCDYARQALHRADLSVNPAVRESAARLRARLKLADT